ncbi:arylsulfatase [Mariniphaga anaerophila]|nr:arylsulfatase [Mariniphaga anaerophila]
MLNLIIVITIQFSGCQAKIKQEAQNSESRPNIILIMSDDMGFSDIGCYGGEIQTPNLDNLAQNGIRFTQFYNGARCCPTRATLLTGLYPHQAGMGWMTGIEAENPAYQGDLNSNCVTLAEVAKTAGYSTFMTGKWHVSKNCNEDGPKHNWPLQRGFDRFYGTINGAGNFYDPATLCRDNTLINPFIDEEYPSEDYYYTDAISDEAARFIKERDKESPFFLYMPYTAAHWPMHAKPEDIKKYDGVYDAGWEEIRKNRIVKMKELGLISSDTELSPLDTYPWTEAKNKDVQAERMEIYAAMIDVMDQGIGRVIETLKGEGIYENTLILFLQDNGGCAEEIGTKGETGSWATTAEELVPLKIDEIEYDVIPRVTREGKAILKGEGVAGGPDTTYVAYGQPWANVSNTPFKEYKHWIHEGGISTPLIAHYPNLIKEANSLNSFPSHIIDIMPTLTELMGANYPEEKDGNKIHPMEGISLVPLFKGEEISRDGAICWEHEMNRAVRLGDWKLVSKGELLDGPYARWTNSKLGEWELYNIAEDRSELNDLADTHPEKLKELATIWDEYAERINVFPNPWTESKKEN